LVVKREALRWCQWLTLNRCYRHTATGLAIRPAPHEAFVEFVQRTIGIEAYQPRFELKRSIRIRIAGKVFEMQMVRKRISA